MWSRHLYDNSQFNIRTQRWITNVIPEVNAVFLCGTFIKVLQLLVTSSLNGWIIWSFQQIKGWLSMKYIMNNVSTVNIHNFNWVNYYCRLKIIEKKDWAKHSWHFVYSMTFNIILLNITYMDQLVSWFSIFLNRKTPKNILIKPKQTTKQTHRYQNLLQTLSDMGDIERVVK